MNHSCVRLAELQGSAECRGTQGPARVPARRAPQIPRVPAILLLPRVCEGVGDHLLKGLQEGAAGREGRELCLVPFVQPTPLAVKIRGVGGRQGLGWAGFSSRLRMGTLQH